MALLAPLPFFTGTFAYLHAPEGWLTILQEHAVLRGPFGVLFSNTAETAGLSVGLIAAVGIVWAWLPGRSPRLRAIVTVVAAALIGMLSSFQTYSFLTFTYLMVYGSAVAVIVHVMSVGSAHSRRLQLASYSCLKLLILRSQWI